METNELKLTLSCEWYDMIDAGIKKEEYRETKPYWFRRLCRQKGKKLTKEESEYLAKIVNETQALGFLAAITQCGITFHNYKQVTFYRGVPYFSDSVKHMTFEIKSTGIGFGKREWGAPEDKHVLKLVLGERL